MRSTSAWKPSLAMRAAASGVTVTGVVADVVMAASGGDGLVERSIPPPRRGEQRRPPGRLRSAPLLRLRRCLQVGEELLEVVALPHRVEVRVLFHLGRVPEPLRDRLA